ncbi:MAG: DUF4142 domain-containing protein [Rudaea sp.]
MNNLGAVQNMQNNPFVRRSLAAWLLAFLLGTSSCAALADSGDHDVTPDEAFIVAATQGGLGEIELSKLALRTAASPEVRGFAARMVQEHTDNNASLASIAQAHNIALPIAPDSDHLQLRDKLIALHGPEFDKIYVEEMRTDHQKMADLLVSASTTVGSDDLRGFIKKTLPVVQRHLRMAQDLKSG